MKIYAARKTGRCANGAERDAGTVIHAVAYPDGRDRCCSYYDDEPAMCGTRPGPRANGWEFIESSGQLVAPLVTCFRCKKKLTREGVMHSALDDIDDMIESAKH